MGQELHVGARAFLAPGLGGDAGSALEAWWASVGVQRAGSGRKALDKGQEGGL